MSEPKYKSAKPYRPGGPIVVRGRGSIYPLDRGGWVISKSDVWVPGSYESQEAAVLALGYCDDILTRLQGEAMQTRPETAHITLAELRAEPQKRCERCVRTDRR